MLNHQVAVQNLVQAFKELVLEAISKQDFDKIFNVFDMVRRFGENPNQPGQKAWQTVAIHWNETLKKFGDKYPEFFQDYPITECEYEYEFDEQYVIVDDEEEKAGHEVSRD